MQVQASLKCPEPHLGNAGPSRPTRRPVSCRDFGPVFGVCSWVRWRRRRTDPGATSTGTAASGQSPYLKQALPRKRALFPRQNLGKVAISWGSSGRNTEPAWQRDSAAQSASILPSSFSGNGGIMTLCIAIATGSTKIEEVTRWPANSRMSLRQVENTRCRAAADGLGMNRALHAA